MGHLLARYHGMEGRNKALKSKASLFYFDIPVFYSLERSLSNGHDMLHRGNLLSRQEFSCFIHLSFQYPFVLSMADWMFGIGH